MAEHREPFADVERFGPDFSIPELKWRELVFVGAVRRDGQGWIRDPTRPLPLFRLPDLFPEGVRFRIERREGRVVVHHETLRPPRVPGP
jgi:hypothetical protein